MEIPTMFESRGSRLHVFVVALAVVSMLMTGLALPEAEAAGPAYDGPPTLATGPAYFGPAPNPFPYCDNPTYFDPFPENVNPIGRIDVTGAPNARVTTNGIEMTFELTGEGAPDSQYPGFFPAPDGEGGAGDQPKGIEMQGGDSALVRLSEPLFYTQWVFTDVDQSNEGFLVEPLWTSAPGQVGVFGGDDQFTFDGTTVNGARFNDGDAQGHPSESLNGRVQVDLLGAVEGIELTRDIGGGQSGFAIGGGCEPVGVAKELTSGPTWNGSSFDVTYTIRVRNNLPSEATIGDDLQDALASNAAAGGSGITTGSPVSIDLTAVTLQDTLSNDAFSNITVVSNDSVSGGVQTNAAYNGDTDINLLAAGEVIPAETEEEFILVVQYTPEAGGPLGPTCDANYDMINQAQVGGTQVGGTADGVDVIDLSDNGADPDPGVNNGSGGVDDPTPVSFECPPVTAPSSLEIVKTVLAGAGASCPAFAAGAPGEGAPLDVEIGDTVTYCIAVRNPGSGDITDVVVSDPQAPAGFDGAIGTLAAGAEQSVQFNLPITDATLERNVASVTGTAPDGSAVPEVSDPANINKADPPVLVGSIDLIKTALAGPNATCPSFADGISGEGAPLDVEIGDTVTYCIAVRNPGNADVTNVVVTDDQAPAGFGTIGTVAAGTETSVSFDLLVQTDTPTRNVASATGTGPNGELPPVDDPANIAPLANAQIDLSKTVLLGADADCSTAVEGTNEFAVGTTGDAITWCFVVTNTGNVALTDVVFNDGPAGITGRDVLENESSPVLAAGQAISFSVNAEIPEGGIENIANVNGAASDNQGNLLPGIDPVQAENPAAVNEAEITLSKTVAAGANADCATATEDVTVNNGTEVTYCFTIANTGGVTVRVAEVSDDTLGFVVSIPEAQQDIVPGASVTVSQTAVTNGDLLNTASVEGVPIGEDGNPIPDAPTLNPTDPASVDTLEANLSIVKSNGGFDRTLVGNIITYTLLVANAGPDPAVGVTVVDSLPAGLRAISAPDTAGWSCNFTDTEIDCDKATPLQPGESATLEYLVQVQTTASVGEALINTATVSSDTPDPDPSDNTDTETTTVDTPLPPAPAPLPDEPLGIVTITNPPPGSTPPPAPAPAPPAPPLALTGSLYSRWLVMAAAAMSSTGGVLFVAGRRRFDSELFD